MSTKTAIITPPHTEVAIFKGDSTLVQQCYDQLHQEIMSGAVLPGAKLKVQPLMARFNMGQGPVREALSRLTATGLVEASENKGFRVMRMSETDVRDTYAIFTYIENLALELAIKHGDAAWEGSVVAALHLLSLVEGDEANDPYEVWAKRNYDFHVALIAGCNSPTLLDMRRRLYMKFDRYCRMAFNATNKNLPANHEEHRKMAGAVLSRNVALTREINTYHINANREMIIAKLKECNLI